MEGKCCRAQTLCVCLPLTVSGLTALTFSSSPHFPLSLPPPQPPVVKTEMVTISDTFAAQKTEIATKEVPIVHTETKTITYEAAQVLTEDRVCARLCICIILMFFCCKQASFLVPVHASMTPPPPEGNCVDTPVIRSNF